MSGYSDHRDVFDNHVDYAVAAGAKSVKGESGGFVLRKKGGT